MTSEWGSIVLFVISIYLYMTRATAGRVWFSLLLFFLGLYVILNLVFIGANYFTGNGITDAVLYTVTNSLQGAGVGKYILPFAGLVALLVIIFALLIWCLKRQNSKQSSKIFSVLAIVLAVFSVTSTQAFLDISRLVKSQLSGDGADFYSYYKTPDKIVKGKKPNLVYIYGESLERTYFNEQVFPGLATELNRHKQNSIDYSNTEQLPGTDWTIAGMVASQCGIPLFLPFEGNSASAISTFYPESVCLGDILKGAGYENYFYQGADLVFAGKGIFLKSHGFDHLYGYYELRNSVSDPTYRNEWGSYDDTVLDEMYKKFIELSKKGEPFSLFGLTVDTHHPDGFISRGCTKKEYDYNGKSNSSLSAVACSQQLIAAFIDKIKESGYYDNTIIVVSSDHLAMNNTAYSILSKQVRTDLFFIMDGRKPVSEVNDTLRSTLDNGATVLDIMGGNNFIGLGRSGLSEKTLAAQHNNIRDKINSWRPAVMKLWRFPAVINDYVFDIPKESFSFSGMTIKIPFILKVSKDGIEPMLNVHGTTPLKPQLSTLAKNDNFVWVDSCNEIGHVWSTGAGSNSGLCIASGNLASPPKIVQAQGDIYKGRIDFNSESAGSQAVYLNTVHSLNTENSVAK